MRESLCQKLVDVIQEIVESDGPWVEKRDQIVDYFAISDERVKGYLDEFLAWFPDVEQV